MRIRILRAALMGAGLAALARPAIVTGQTAMRGRLSVAAELGTQSFTDTPLLRDRAKLEEYKSVPSGTVLQQLLVGYVPADSFRLLQIVARNVGQVDQTVQLRVAQPGQLDILASWDRTPHLFSTNARMAGSQVGLDRFTLPTPRPDTSTWNSTAPTLAPVRTRWDAAKVTALYTPGSQWELKAEAMSIAKRGQRPMGMAFGTPDGNTREILEPIDQRTTSVRLAPAYSTGRFQLTGLVDLSYFENAYASVSADNPLMSADSPTAGAATGRTALAPGNTAQTTAINGALNLPLGTRVYGSASYAWWQQDAAFIPATSNAVLAADPRLAGLPTRLGGAAGTTQLSIWGSSRPVTSVSVSARYREFRYRDNTAFEVMPALAINDRSIAAAAERERFPFTRKNIDFSASWRPGFMPVTITAGHLWDHVERDIEVHRVASLSELVTRASTDYTPVDWLNLRTSFSRGFRRSPAPYTHHASDPDLRALRRFDEADRNRDRGVLQLLITPLDAISVAANWEFGRDEYPHTEYGVQNDRSSMVGADFAWTPASRWSFDASFTRETFLNRLRSHYRAPGILDNASYDWVANNRDDINTLSAGFRAIIVPDRWEVGGQYSLSDAAFNLDTYNPVTPTGGTAAQNLAATAVNLPRVTQKLQPLAFFARYQYSSDWALTLKYQAERYDQDDFRTNGLRLQEGGGIFLGHDIGSYEARYLTMTVSYRPVLLRRGRPAM